MNTDVITETKNDIQKETLKLVEELNNKISDNSGRWLNIQNIGIVWQPSSEWARSVPAPVPPSSPPPLLGELVKWGDVFDFDNLPQNAVIIIRLNVDDPMRVNTMQRVIAEKILEPRIEKLKEKRICILFMQSGDDISVMTEEDMNAIGWTKMDKSLIINPFDK